MSRCYKCKHFISDPYGAWAPGELCTAIRQEERFFSHNISNCEFYKSNLLKRILNFLGCLFIALIMVAIIVLGKFVN